METEEIIKGLRRYSQDYYAYKLESDTAEAIYEASKWLIAFDYTIAEQRARIAELEKELDAAVADMKVSNTRKFNDPCEFWRNYGKQCAPVDLQDVCRLWEWRGCKAEEGEPT